MAAAKISVVMVAYDMAREVPRTLQSFAADYQVDAEPDDYEVIVVDNGSPTPLDSELVRSFGPNFSCLRIEDATPSPAPAINRGVAACSGEIVGLMVDAARLVTPGLLKAARQAFAEYRDPTVATLGWHLGPNAQQKSISRGYTKEVEDGLLARIGWPTQGYRLFEIASPALSSRHGLRRPLRESNLIFLRRTTFEELEGYDESFDAPGGGFVNLDFYKRSCERSSAPLVILLGEGSFHQIHGGVATNVPMKELRRRISEWSSQYTRIRGEPWRPPSKVGAGLGSPTAGISQPAEVEATGSNPGSIATETDESRDRTRVIPPSTGALNYQHLAPRSGLVLAVRITGAGLSFLLTLALARWLGAEALGLFFLALSTVTFATVIGRLGVHQALLQAVGQHAGASNWGGVKGASRSGLRLGLFVSLVVTATLLLSAPLIAGSLFSKPELLNPLRLAALAVPSGALLAIYSELLKAVGRAGASAGMQAGITPALTLLLSLALVPPWGVEGAIAAYVVASAVACGAARALWLRSVPQLREVSGTVPLRPLVRSALDFLALDVLPQAADFVAIAALGVWAPSAAVAVFGVATRVVSIPALILSAANAVAAPVLAGHYQRGEHHELAAVARSTAGIISLASTPILLLLILAPGPTMGLFGSHFEAGALVLVILSLGQLVNVAVGSVGLVLMMSGREQALVRVHVVAAVSQVGLVLAVVPVLGAIGAAMGKTLALLLRNFSALFLVRRHLGFFVYPTRCWQTPTPHASDSRRPS